MDDKQVESGPNGHPENRVKRYFGPRLYHEIPDCRAAVESGQLEWSGVPSACNTPVRVFFSLMGLAASAVLVAATLLWIGAQLGMRPSFLAGMVVMATGAALACTAFCLWLALLCGGCRGCRCRRLASRRKVDADGDRDAILPPSAVDHPQVVAHRLKSAAFRPRFLPPLQPVYEQQQQPQQLSVSPVASVETVGSSTTCSSSSSSSSGTVTGSASESDSCSETEKRY